MYNVIYAIIISELTTIYYLFIYFFFNHKNNIIVSHVVLEASNTNIKEFKTINSQGNNIYSVVINKIV